MMTSPSRHDGPALGWTVLSVLPTTVRAWLSRWRSRRFIRRFRFARTAAWEQAPLPVDWPTSPTAGPGMNLFGYLQGEFGLAEAARAYARAGIQGGVPMALKDVEIETPHSHRDQRLQAHLASTPLPHAIDAVFINPDNFSRVLAQPVERVRAREYLMGFWFWELPRVPEAWDTMIAQVDEVLVATDYVADAFRGRTDKPVTKIPYPLFRPSPSALGRADFGLPETAFVFLVTFDFNSSVQRKNPGAVITAFRAAFPLARGDVRLLIKSTNGHLNASAVAGLLGLVEGDPRILIRDDVLPAAHLHALQACCDAYVSLHRAEGLGLGLAECMSLGKPVIATGWSGNLEFMSGENSLLVDARLIPVPSCEYPFAEGQQWADPDVSHAAALMRQMADDPAAAAALGAIAARHVERVLAPERTAAALIERLHQIASANRGGAPFLVGAIV